MEEHCLYLRKSRVDLEAEARGEGDTLATHERTLMALAKRLKLTITHIYREVVSGERISERPEMIQLLQDVEAGRWDGVLVVEVERLARGDTMDQGLVAQAFKYSETKIITPMKTYDPNNEHDEEYFEFGLFMSRREFKTITRRLQRGRIHAVEDGRFMGSVPPYGYERYKLDGKGYSLKPVQEQALMVKMIFDWYVNEGLGTSLIANRLNEMGIPTIKGRQWIVATLRNIIRNPVYIGRVRWNNRPTKKKRVDGEIITYRPYGDEPLIVDGLHDAIVDEGIWNQAQEIMDGRRQVPSLPDKITNPLAGLVRCGVCERAMIRRPYYDNRPASFICSFPTCANVGSYFEIVETRLLQGLKEWLKQYKAEWGKRKPKNNDEEQTKLKEQLLRTAERQLDELNLQKGNLHDLLEKKVYTIDLYLERSQALSGRIQDAQQALESAARELEKEKKRSKARTNIIPHLESVLGAYHRTDDAGEKNKLLKTVLDHTVYKKEKKGHWRRPETIDEFELILYPKLP